MEMAWRTIEFPILLLTRDEEQLQEAAGAAETRAIKKIGRESVTDVHRLPDPILEEILTRIPARTVFDCKTVSKLWLSIVNGPNFALRHFKKAPFCPLFVYRSGSKKILHLVEGETPADLDVRMGVSELSSKFQFCFDRPLVRNSGYFLPVNTNATSCEGLVCFASYSVADSIFICNPITGEHASLYPRLVAEEVCIYVFIGLGYCNVTRRYELLRMACWRMENDAEVSRWWPEVCTLLDTHWTRVGNETFQLDLAREICDVVYVNGTLYWRYDEDSFLCSFNFASDKFQVIPLPQMSLKERETNNVAAKGISLGVLSRSPCVSLVAPDDGHVELWVLNFESVCWNKTCDVDCKTTCLEHSGILGSRGQYKAIKYLSGGLILMHDWRETFVIYDPNKRRETHIRALDHSFTGSSMQVVPHVPSLVKLKDALRLDEALTVFTVTHSWRDVSGWWSNFHFHPEYC